MTMQPYSNDSVDIFEAKDRVVNMIRFEGAQPFSRILMTSRLSEKVLGNVLELLEKEKKIKVQMLGDGTNDEPVYQPVTGSWVWAGIKR